MPRPLGVTIIAAIQFTGAALLIAVVLALRTGMLQSIVGASPAAAVLRSRLLARGNHLAAIGVLVFVCFLLTLGYGMWNLKRWARIATVTIEAAGATASVFAFFWALAHVAPLALLITSVRFGISLIILWYLSRPHVVRAFNLVRANSTGVAL